MRILITGANGYIGRHVVKAACDAGYEVIANDLNLSDVDPRAERNDYPIFSTANEPLLEKLGRPHVCIHLAWKDGFVHNSPAHMEMLSSHIAFFHRMIEEGIHSFASMGSMHEVGYWNGEIREDTPCNPLSQYGIAKNAMRQSILLSAAGNRNVRWLRAFYITGDDIRGNSVFGKIARAAQEGKKSFPFTSGVNQYDFIDVDELARMIIACTLQDDVTGVINVCSGKPMSLANCVEKFIQDNHLNIQLEYGAYPERKYDSPRVWGETEKLTKAMNAYQRL